MAKRFWHSSLALSDAPRPRKTRAEAAGRAAAFRLSKAPAFCRNAPGPAAFPLGRGPARGGKTTITRRFLHVGREEARHD